MVAREALAPMADCLFCSIAAGTTPAHLVVDEPEVVAFLDIRPVFKGHTLVVPRHHRGTFAELDGDEVGGLFGAAQRVAGAVEQALGAGGAWVSLNDRVSQSVPHVHVHVVPRTKGDGLRGFYWPRTTYADDDEAASYAARLRRAYGG
jgi:histidine triad (HIT) family protein